MENKNTKNKDRGAFACCDEQSYLQEGLTKREYFAIQILAGMNANGMTTQEGVEPPYCMRKEDRCKYAVEQADCLLEALSKP